MRRGARKLLSSVALGGAALCAAAGVVSAGAPAADAGAPARRWAIGWDPGDDRAGLVLRRAFGPGWDLSLSAGPDDYKNDSDRRFWDSSDPAELQGELDSSGRRRESGWVRVAAARRFWSEGRFAAAALTGVSYAWSNEQEDHMYVSTVWAEPDIGHERLNSRQRAWRFALALRPAYALSTRLGVEFEAGLGIRTGTDHERRYTWYDGHPNTTRRESDISDHAFYTSGGFDWYRLKFLFWF